MLPLGINLDCANLHPDPTAGASLLKKKIYAYVKGG
jgi:hypothetical protein